MSLFIPVSSPTAVFTDPAAQLAPLSPLASLAAANPPAALAKLSPVLNIFNPAINPNAALLAFNPAAAPTLALTSGFGQVALPFGYARPFAKPVAVPTYGIPAAILEPVAFGAKPVPYRRYARPVAFGTYAKPVVW